MDIYEQCKTQANRVTRLKIDVVLEQLSKKDADSLKKALLDETIPSRGIEKVLIDNNSQTTNRTQYKTRRSWCR